MKDMVKIIIRENERKKLDSVSLFATTAKRRILDLSDDVFKQIVSHMNTSPFYAIRLNKSPDIAGLTQLSLFY